MAKKLNGMVEIPAATLNALKGLLFDENGINVSPIINDLSIGMNQANKDLLEINVGLVMKGLKPSLDIPAILYEGSYRCLNIYVYKGFSLIEGVAVFDQITASFKIEDETMTWYQNNSSINTPLLGIPQVEKSLKGLKDAVNDIRGLEEKEKELMQTEKVLSMLKKIAETFKEECKTKTESNEEADC